MLRNTMHCKNYVSIQFLNYQHKIDSPYYAGTFHILNFVNILSIIPLGSLRKVMYIQDVLSWCVCVCIQQPYTYLHAHFTGSTCETFSDLCVGNHSVSVRAVSPVCDGVEGSSVVKFSIRPNLFVPGVTGVDGDTTGGTCSAEYEHKITVNKPSTLKCRIVCETE